MLKIVPAIKNKTLQAVLSADYSRRQTALQMNILTWGRGFLPRPLLFGGLALFGVLLLLSVIPLAIVRRSPSSAYRVSYQEFVVDPNGYNSSTLYHMRPDGSYARQFVPLEYGVIKGGVSWSPDASEIVFMRITDIGQPAVEQTAWYDLQTKPLILATRTDIPQPQWSPDGRYIALSLRGTLIIWDVAAATHLYYEEPPEGTWYHSPVWLPSSEAVLVIAREANEDVLLKINVADGEIVPITTSIREITNQRMQTPTVSPDGKSVAVNVSNPNFGNDYIALIDLHEKTVRTISDTPFGQFNPRWSPDGQWLIYNNGGFQVGQIGASVYRVNLKTGVTQEFPHSVHSASGLVWSPDGRWLFYALPEDNTWNIYRSDRNGNHAERLTNSPNAQLFPTVSPLMDKAWHGWVLGLLGVGGLIIIGAKVWRDTTQLDREKTSL